MATNSDIEWTDATWNPVTGCSKISPGCKHSYAARMANRLHAMKQANYKNGFDVTLQPQMLELPLQWKSPKRIFVNSMSDLFHPEVPLSYIIRVFAIMHRAPWHQYQILTKRSKRLLELNSKLHWAPQIWMGVSDHWLLGMFRNRMSAGCVAVVDALAGTHTAVFGYIPLRV